MAAALRRLVYALRVLSETHTATMPIRDIIARMRHDGCGGMAGKVELSSLPHRSQVIRMYHDGNAASGSSRATQLQAFGRSICMARYRRYAPTLFQWRISWSKIGDTKRASTISRRSITNSGMAPTLAS